MNTVQVKRKIQSVDLIMKMRRRKRSKMRRKKKRLL